MLRQQSDASAHVHDSLFGVFVRLPLLLGVPEWEGRMLVPVLGFGGHHSVHEVGPGRSDVVLGTSDPNGRGSCHRPARGDVADYLSGP